jgi:hypothetical protein
MSEVEDRPLRWSGGARRRMRLLVDVLPYFALYLEFNQER